jgi:hypothetical protein
VNQIANCDKHWEGLVDVQMSPMLASFGFVGGGGYMDRLDIMPRWPEGLVKQHESERTLLAFGKDVPDSKGKAGIGVVFGDIRPVAGKDILITLHSQAAEVQRIVQLFLRTFF